MKPINFLSTGVDPDLTISSQEIEHHLDDCNPKECVLFSHSPSVQVYFALRNRLEKSSEKWMQEFVSLEGLDSLLDSLGHMVGPKYCGFSDAILQMDCLSCIRSVLNSQVGMDALVRNPEALRKLLKGIDLANTLPRKHVIEILSVVCVYSQAAYKSLLEAMNEHKRENHLYHRFSFIVNELKVAETVPHKTAVLTLINSVICCHKDRQSRCRIRNEFIGLTLLDVLAFLQREDTDEDLSIQLQVFQDKKSEDEAIVDLNSSLDLSSPQDLADAIQSRVFGSTKMVSFVNILQDLLSVETSNKQKCDMVWQVLERHVHHIIHAVDDVSTLSSVQAETACQVIEKAINDGAGNTILGVYNKNNIIKRQFSSGVFSDIETKRRNNTATKNHNTFEGREVTSLKTSADSGYLGCEERLSPRVGNRVGLRDISSSQNVSPEDMGMKQVNSNQYNRQKNDRQNSGTLNLVFVPDEKKYQREASMYDNMSSERTPIVNKLDASCKYDQDKYKPQKLTNINNLAAEGAMSSISATTRQIFTDTNLFLNLKEPYLPSSESESLTIALPSPRLPVPLFKKPWVSGKDIAVFPAYPMKNLKWIKLNQSVVAKFPNSLWANSDTKEPKIHPDLKRIEEIFQETTCHAETPLLSNQMRISLNLFLNRLEEEPTELVKCLIQMDGPGLSLPFVKHLVDIMPEHEEMQQLKHYNGNLLELGAAEQFVLHLCDLPDYQVLLAGHLRRSEFAVVAPRLHSVLDAMLDVSRAVLCSEGFKEVMLLLLKVGNFLNNGQFNGYADGFRLSSLARLSDVKSSIAGHSLLHYVVSEVEAKNSTLFTFLTEIPRLEKAASSSLSDIKDEFDKLNTKINTFVRQLAGTNPMIREGFDPFLEEVKSEFRELQAQLTELKHQSQQLSDFFCESDSFDLQRCFKLLLNFFKELRRCRHETHILQKQKDMATKHCNMFKLQQEKRQNVLKMGQTLDVRKLLVEEIMTELHRGNFERPQSINSALATLAEEISSSKDICDGNTAGAPDRSEQGSQSGQAGRDPGKLREGAITPVHGLNNIELSRISLIGTPMMNRPQSDVWDEDVTPVALDKRPFMTTSSVQDLQRDHVTSAVEMRAPPVQALNPPLARLKGKKTHHRSRSDLGESSSGATKWIRYQQQQRELQTAPLARPESSLTLATLNLEARGAKRYRTTPYPTRPIVLLPSPTIVMPSGGDFEVGDVEPQEFMRGGKRGERKSGTLSNLLTKISKKVLRQRNVSEQNLGTATGKGNTRKARNSNSGSEDGMAMEVWESKGETARHNKGGSWGKAKTSSSSLGRAAGTQLQVKRSKSSDKENVEDVNPFDRQKKNPIRLSNRFKGKKV